MKEKNSSEVAFGFYSITRPFVHRAPSVLTNVPGHFVKLTSNSRLLFRSRTRTFLKGGVMRFERTNRTQQLWKFLSHNLKIFILQFTYLWATLTFSGHKDDIIIFIARNFTDIQTIFSVAKLVQLATKIIINLRISTSAELVNGWTLKRKRNTD